jgi:hypothetical protein
MSRAAGQWHAFRARTATRKKLISGARRAARWQAGTRDAQPTCRAARWLALAPRLVGRMIHELVEEQTKGAS